MEDVKVTPGATSAPGPHVTGGPRHADKQAGHGWFSHGHLGIPYISSVLWFIISKLAAPVLTIFYPLHETLVAMEAPAREEGEQWMTYWIVYALLAALEGLFYPIFGDGSWMRIMYHTPKLLLLTWMALPQYRGAQWVYENVVRVGVQELQKRKIVRTKGGVGRGKEQQQSLNDLTPKTRRLLMHLMREMGPRQAEEFLLKAVANSEGQATPSTAQEAIKRAEETHEE